jgi:hypothetical protein
VGGCDILTFDKEDAEDKKTKYNLNTRKHGSNSEKPVVYDTNQIVCGRSKQIF